MPPPPPSADNHTDNTSLPGEHEENARFYPKSTVGVNYLQAEGIDDIESLITADPSFIPLVSPHSSLQPKEDEGDQPTSLLQQATIHLSNTTQSNYPRNADETTPSHEKDKKVPFLPGNASIFVKTWGCGHNNSDGEYMAGALAAQGYSILLEDERKSEADLWLLNSCTVKGPSEQTFLNEIQRAQAAGKHVVVAGCVPSAAPTSNSAWNGMSVIGVQQIDHVVQVVEQTLQGNTIKLLGDRKISTVGEGMQATARKAGGAKLDMPKVRRNPWIEIIPINTGCLNQCTYCKTKHARGDLGSYHPDEIVDRLNAVLNEGVKEIWLTSEDTGAYGRDIGVSIVDLLRQLLKAMDAHPVQDAFLRLGMTNPPYILEHIQEIGEILCHPKVYSFLHVPIQAASDKVLEDMRRQYTLQDFEYVVDHLRRVVPRMTIATDIICGFPSETDQDWQETMQLLRKYRFPVLHISQFYPRPGTPAARLSRLPTDQVKARSREASALFESYTTYDEYVGERQTILVTEISGDGVHYIGHNKSYQQVLVPADERIMGQRVDVVIERCGKYFLQGQVVPESLEILSPLPTPTSAAITAAGDFTLNRARLIPKFVRKRKGLVRVNPEVELQGASSSDGHLSMGTSPIQDKSDQKEPPSFAAKKGQEQSDIIDRRRFAIAVAVLLLTLVFALRLVFYQVNNQLK